MSSPEPRRRSRRRLTALACGAATLAGIPLLITVPTAAAEPIVSVSSVTTPAGELFTATNHLVDLPGVKPAGDPDHQAKEYLVVWAGDNNAVDTTGADIQGTPLSVGPVRALAEKDDSLPGPDFLAVIDADKDSEHYGTVVNTVTLGPLVENEPHHMQYLHHKGDHIYAGSLFLDTTYVLDTTKLPLLELSGVNTPVDSPCGTVPDAYEVLSDGTAYGTYMGGPDLPGPCTYTNGEVRIGNGYAGSPGSLVRIGTDGRTLSEVPAATPNAEFPDQCHNLPALPQATCANPHGIQVREDLNRMVTSDYCEPRNIILDPVKAPDHKLCRPTVRTWDITDRDNAKVVDVALLPDGPRTERNPAHEENQAIMEVGKTHLPEHKGVFAESMCGGAIYYRPDITDPESHWRQVFDITQATKAVHPEATEGGGCSGGGAVEVSLDDKYLYHVVIGRGPGAEDYDDPGGAKMVFTLDIQKLLAAGNDPDCVIDTIEEVSEGGKDPDCPELIDVLPFEDTTTGGPHWAATDNYARNGDGTYSETKTLKRLSVANYFVARTGIDGNHKVCMVDVDNGELTLDEEFLDEKRGGACVNFNRTVWPHGEYGDAKPHSQLFVVAEDDVR